MRDVPDESEVLSEESKMPVLELSDEIPQKHKDRQQ